MATADAQVLILGSLPGRVSLRHGEYYAHPRNTFWTIIGQLFGVSPDLPYQQRLAGLTACGVALWDVCASGCRPGSMDSNLSDIVPNDFDAFFRNHSGIQLICLNGSMAGKLYSRRVLPDLAGCFAKIRRIVLPSTSPAHARIAYGEKLNRWREALYSALPNDYAPRISVLR